MCYSAQIRAEYKHFVREFGAKLSIRQYIEIYWHRRENKKLKIPRAVDFSFSSPQTDDERELKRLIDDYDASLATEYEQTLFKQRKRFADAERSLKSKTTVKATEDLRIATDKVTALLKKIEWLKRTSATESDSRIFPLSYAPIMIAEHGQRVVKLMRYQCRPVGKPAFYDTKYPGTYNARRDNLEKFWKGQFGHTHGVMLASAFYENVKRKDEEGTEKNVVLKFEPNTHADMLVACLWSHSTGDGEPELYSFAAITDAPPPEVEAAGHDRCIIPIKAQNLDRWLNPDPANLHDAYAVLDDRERPYYEHRLAA